MKKKIISLVIMAAVTLSLIACGKKSEPEPAEKIALEPETTADIDEYFAGLTPARERALETVAKGTVEAD